MKKNKTYIICALLLVNTYVFAQGKPIGNYIILSFEHSNSNGPHGIQEYFWIIPADSIRSYDTPLAKLFLNEGSKNDVEDCCAQKDINPYYWASKKSFDFDKRYFDEMKKLDKILSKRKKIQTITKKWDEKKLEKIVIYATPITGNFCLCEFSETGQSKFSYFGKVAVPVSSFEYNAKFWKSDVAKFILKRDFYGFNFSVLPL